ncbi:DUF3172 domain-containing protein [Phormidesmis priestleyi ULC007]|uniref:DUF3172 domain-containing protein n=1 Tax=Phormidesmis priestleyi ULC007 TaxID=1920490 RepID=A0A2T1DE06_9CYAN|nr:DUF3172 domain-containing protein [Phormidesmis priestleyi]PSB18696.1 DUF3172 domain-containing protein [Phormidesmis priestleyi ULC007]PZO51543.1 MAG: DUF3172 domain-containing protein [Phormidesmis priestleyi]
MKRRPKNSSYDYERDDEAYTPPDKGKQSKPKTPFNYTSLFIIAGIFILGIGVGIGFSSTASTSDTSVVSNVQIDARAPNAEICIQNGASAIALETRFFVTLNPFKVYVAQANTQPGCVLRSASWQVLEQRNLITPEQVRACRQRMNTFSYVGALESNPKIDCVYQSDSAKNLFLAAPGSGAAPPENEKF